MRGTAQGTQDKRQPSGAQDFLKDLLTSDGGQSFNDTTGQQTSASFYNTQQGYDGDGLRVQKTESGQTTYYLRSSVLSGQVVCELNTSGGWQRGYVYQGSQLLAVQ